MAELSADDLARGRALPVVEGHAMMQSIDGFERDCLIQIARLMDEKYPDAGTISVLAQAVRCAREFTSYRALRASSVEKLTAERDAAASDRAALKAQIRQLPTQSLWNVEYIKTVDVLVEQAIREEREPKSCDVCEYEFEGGDRKHNVVCTQCWPHDWAIHRVRQDARDENARELGAALEDVDRLTRALAALQAKIDDAEGPWWVSELANEGYEAKREVERQQAAMQQFSEWLTVRDNMWMERAHHNRHGEGDVCDEHHVELVDVRAEFDDVLARLRETPAPPQTQALK